MGEGQKAADSAFLKQGMLGGNGESMLASVKIMRLRTAGNRAGRARRGGEGAGQNSARKRI